MSGHGSAPGRDQLVVGPIGLPAAANRARSSPPWRASSRSKAQHLELQVPHNSTYLDASRGRINGRIGAPRGRAGFCAGRPRRAYTGFLAASRKPLWPSPTARNLTIDGQRLLEIPAVSGRTRASRRNNVLLQAHRESSPGRPRLSFSASNRRVPGSLESYASHSLRWPM